ncbi:LOW QUALITY PROTEIN: death-associated protein-like 1 [Rhea pennata]|uniref:LOW QUALITY PROTEIN: death-associated protein-like 1 n=1 Tax=Rhea pennata TaxID=8795 RepID=UPI002E252260
MRSRGAVVGSSNSPASAKWALKLSNSSQQTKQQCPALALPPPRACVGGFDSCYQQLFAVKAGGMRVSKKQDDGFVGKYAKIPRNENIRSHEIPAAVLQVSHQKPQPVLEKFMLPKRIYIIQQPQKY